jgi:photosystem II stability/assembly factor-like uncharacterized protein
MRKILLAMLFILQIFCCAVYAQWIQLDAGINANLYSTYFINDQKGWIAGENIILITTNGGESWQQILLQGSNYSIYFIDESTGWVCNNEGKILKTTDAGLNWEVKHTEELTELTSISFANENVGLAVGHNRTILITNDGGESWQHALNENFDHLLSSFIYSESLMFTYGANGAVYRSYDGGAVWDSLNVGMPNGLYAASFVTPSIGFMFGCCGAYFRTTDGGENWEDRGYITTGDIIYSGHFVNETIGWVAGELGWLLKTTDGGESWSENGPSITDELRSVFFVNENIGYVVGFNGTIYKTVNGGGSTTGISEFRESNPDGFYLSQNYPNPFNPSTVISWQSPVGSHQTLKVYDVLGYEVATLVNEYKHAGSYEVEFDAVGLPSGVYFYQLRAGTYVETKNMVLLR